MIKQQHFWQSSQLIDNILIFVNIHHPVKILNSKQRQLNPNATIYFQYSQLYKLISYFRIVNIPTEGNIIDLIQGILVDI